MATLLANPGWQIINDEARTRMDRCVAAMVQEDVQAETRALIAAEYRTLETIVLLPGVLSARAQTHLE